MLWGTIVYISLIPISKLSFVRLWKTEDQQSQRSAHPLPSQTVKTVGLLGLPNESSFHIVDRFSDFKWAMYNETNFTTG